MSRKRSRQDSLELFLDAICNMFGGFLFLMLFVVVSIRATREAVSKRDDATIVESEIAALDVELTNLRAERDALAKQVQKTKETLDSLLDPSVADVYRQAVEKRNLAINMEKSNEAIVKEIADLQKKRDELQTQTSETRQKIDNLRSEEKEILLATKKESLEKAQTISPPQLKRSNKVEVAVLLKYGKLYFWHKQSDSNSERKLNDEDFVVVEETENVLITEPKPWRGLDLDSHDAERRLEQAFAAFDPNVEQIGVIVAGDSYEEYGVLRSFLKKRQFEIRPIIGKPGVGVFDRGGEEALTQ